MTRLRNQPAPPAAPACAAKLLERLRALDIPVATVDSAGHCDLLACQQPFQNLVVRSQAFASAIHHLRPQLQQHPYQRVDVWPGVSVICLPPAARRRHHAPLSGETLVLAVLFSRDLPASEQLHQICQAQGLDHQAVLRQIETEKLFSPPEVLRLAAAISWIQQDSVEVNRRYEEIQSLSQQLGDSYEELSLLYKFSSNMSVNQPSEHFFQAACAELHQVVGLRWLALQLVQDDARANTMPGKLFVAGQLPCDQTMLTRMANLILLHQPHPPRSMVYEDPSSLGIPHVAKLAKHLLVIPLRRDDRTLGILLGGDKVDGSAISSVDVKLCDALTSSLSIFLQNLALFEDMQAMFMGAMHALTSAIDAKDSYTHGHSERVAVMAQALARAAGLEEKIIERVYLSGLVHDVGKIGVPEAVLTKPGTLTDEEFRLIKMHPEIGARIIQDIRPMKDLIPGVLHHHERWDGSGYPYSLAGTNIPLFGRLVALADSFDAMSSNRAYRPSMSHDQVLREIKRCAGVQFDPELTEKFVQLDFKPFYELIQRHQAAEGLRRSA
ncbi:MAG: HD-GYP domain-containing protein [Phycisphaeraceae bacterium]|nr:HD-GYP domain-containing protein [Phycisphaeraceae bacterium]